MALKLVIFDLDGTLLDSGLDFEAMRAEIGLRPGTPVLEGVEGLPPADRARAWQVIDRHEAEAAERARPMPGALDLVAWLHGRGIKVAALTRNNRASLRRAAERHALEFDAAVTREDGAPKPRPDGVHRLMAACGAGADETILVGDFRFDIEAGRCAGVRTVALAPAQADWAREATWRAGDLEAVRGILARLAEKVSGTFSG